MSDRAKITEAHRRRRAVVYVRQSTPAQVERNVESTRAAVRAARPRGRAGLAGRSRSWSSTRISAARARRRDGRFGFKELVAEVGLGQVGLVLALEVSRLARSSADWHQLLDLCALTGTLIADTDGIYSPQDFNDRLLLGLKGTMSEAELHLIRSRLDGGLRNKAKRGELELSLPVGLDRDEDGRIVLGGRRAGASRDRARVHVVAAAGVGAPGRPRADRRGAEAAAPDRRVAAGAVGARQLWRRARPADQPGLCRARSCSAAAARQAPRRATGACAARTVELPIEQWSVCLPEHHPGYVSWDEYLRRASGCAAT